MIEAFSEILELDIAARAKSVKDQLQTVTDLYFYETWDASEVITSALDLVFSRLEYETSEFAQQVHELDRSINELSRIYKQFVLSQAVVILVSSLEVYLSAVFTSCLSGRLSLNDRAISGICSRYNFQNWGSSVDAFRTFLEMELCPQGIDSSHIIALQQKRHVLVHQMGIIDERAVRQLKLSPSLVGKHLEIRQSEVLEGIELVRAIGEHLYQGVILGVEEVAYR